MKYLSESTGGSILLFPCVCQTEMFHITDVKISEPGTVYVLLEADCVFQYKQLVTRNMFYTFNITHIL